MINLKDLMDTCDNWNLNIVVNDDDLNRVIEDVSMWDFYKKYENVLDKVNVIAFGVYDNDFCVRTKESGLLMGA